MVLATKNPRRQKRKLVRRYDVLFSGFSTIFDLFPQKATGEEDKPKAKKAAPKKRATKKVCPLLSSCI